jgi:CheY-like chemotaxis protein
VALNDLLAGSTDLLKRLIGEHINLAFAPGAELGRVRVDPGQMEQVIVNLVVNARDAMPEGGQVTLETANVELDAAYAARHVDLVAGSYVRLAVTDTGTGMSREIQARIFEPFFTTKGPGKGTGLGLSTVYGIVKQSGGHIRVYSELGAGTTFRVYLPRTDAVPDASVAAALDAPMRGTETILLVEDEAEVRSVTREVLEDFGYTVLEAAEATDALLIARRRVGMIDLLLTDVVMPRMSGRALAEAIAAERPETRILFMSGYTDDAIVLHRVLEPGANFLEKPFSAPVLARKVREVLDTS